MNRAWYLGEQSSVFMVQVPGGMGYSSSLAERKSKAKATHEM